MKEYYKKEILEEAVKRCYSFAEVLREIGISDKGSNTSTLKKYIELYNIDTTHFRGQTWNKGLSFINKTVQIPLEDILKENTNFKSDSLKYRLIAEGLKEYKCENPECGLSEWLGKPIVLELHHINGNHFDNRLENLQILCPNCHSQTENYRGRKKYLNKPKPQKRKKYICKCEVCGKEFSADRERRFCSREHYNIFLNQNKKENILSEDSLKEAITKVKTITELSNMFNTSRPTIRKYLEKYNLMDLFQTQYADATRSKKVIQYDLNMNFIKEWGGITDAEESLGIKSINKCASLKRKTAGGFI